MPALRSRADDLVGPQDRQAQEPRIEGSGRGGVREPSRVCQVQTRPGEIVGCQSKYGRAEV